MTPEIQAEAPSVPRYAIDFGWFEHMMRDFPVLAQSRMCPSCQARLGTEVEERVPGSDAAGQVVFAPQRTRYGDDPFAVIAECCSQRPEYRSPRLPLLEIVFRLFLENHNTPLTPQEITDRVLDWVGPGDGRVVTPEVLERLFLADDFYGFRRIEEAALASEPALAPSPDGGQEA